ncbi:hypothetical protein [Vreelandella nigrificans]|uniref:DUF4124 domain-containing protein n=1 Tax=Vreelandella nigrificans TaxID=2042704 RepID=A0A2A4HTK6_9GAMM|nr:hypothetical protein [Halomonas nigrificans]PCF97737.1 hypothetical protein CPA45_03145 [Halomonas nigrificans]
MYNCFQSRLLPLSVALGLLLSLSACTTYTWPDGSQETVLGVVPEDDNQRYEERQAQGVRYRLPDDIPETH